MSSESVPYKARKEAFVSNLSGSSLLDINLVTLVAPAGILLWTALQKRQSFFVANNVITKTVDFLLNVGAILFAFTLYSSAPLALNVFLAVPAIFLLLPLLPSGKTTRSASKHVAATESATGIAKQNSASSSVSIPSRPFITHYRGAMMIATCMAILAVDFPVFPRRFAKVETWGTSLMDLGVGSFVFSAGVVSARQVVALSMTTASGSSTVSAVSTTASTTQPRLYQRLFTSLRHSAPLIVLGLVRLYSVKGLDYAEHVTEYGVHWNFFFTLGLLPPFVELSDFLIKTVFFGSYDVLAIVIALIYEIVLDNTSLLSFILISPRGPSLLAKNREGVFSFIGYLAIFLSGRGIGTKILPFRASTPARKPSSKTLHSGVAAVHKDRRRILQSLLVTAATYSILFVICRSYQILNLNVSRRLANAPYVFWIAAFNNAQLFVFAAIEHLGPEFVYCRNLSGPSTNTKGSGSKGELREELMKPEDASSQVMQAFNRNGLAIFLAANLMTGLVNLTFNTLDAGNATGMGILIGYAIAVTGLAMGLQSTGIRIKL